MQERNYHPFHPVRRGNLEDALQKLQKFIDTAALQVQPIESDPEKKKKLAKQ